MESPLAIVTNITDSWVKNLWVQCTCLCIRIYTNLPNFQLPWIGDIEIMQIFLQHGVHTDELMILNCPTPGKV